MAATEAQLQQGLLDTQGRRVAWNQLLDSIQQDADGLSLRTRGRHLPAANTLGQLPYADVRIDKVVGGQERGEVQTTIIPAADILWQNLANYISDTRQAGLDELGQLEDELNAALTLARQQAAGGTPTAPSQQPGKDPKKLAPWVQFIANIIAYVVVFYGLTVAAHAFNPFNFGVVAALLVLTVILGGVITKPIAGAIMTIFGAIIQILQDLIDFVIQWFNGILQYFQGDFIRAILQILEVAAFMYLWSFAQRIPVIGNLIKLITEAVGTVVNWINQTFDTVIKFLEWVRKQAEDSIGLLFDTTTSLGKLLVQSFDQQIDRVIGGLEGKLNTLRFQLLAQVDILRQFANSTITVFGFRLQLVPDEVRKYLLTYGQANPVASFVDTADLIARSGPGFASGTLAVFTPWVLADEMMAAMRGIYVGQPHDVERNAIAMIDRMQVLNAGGVADTPDLPPELLQVQLPGQQGPPAPPPLGRPPWVPAGDWATVTGLCGAGHIAYLVAAIGQHETHWGLTGAGRDGFILGVGVFGGVEQEQFRGLVNQLLWACPRLETAFPGPGDVTRAAVISFGATVYKVPDPTGWGNDVFDLFASVWIPSGGTIA